MGNLAQFKFNEYAACLFEAFILLIFHRRRKDKGSRLPFPPGPPRLPVIGNIHQMSLTHLWEKAAEWGKTYGKYLALDRLMRALIIRHRRSHLYRKPRVSDAYYQLLRGGLRTTGQAISNIFFQTKYDNGK